VRVVLVHLAAEGFDKDFFVHEVQRFMVFVQRLLMERGKATEYKSLSGSQLAVDKRNAGCKPVRRKGHWPVLIFLLNHGNGFCHDAEHA
ncbi:MAG: hypothetical protein QMB17_05940, partial [Polaromonas sp.]